MLKFIRKLFIYPSAGFKWRDFSNNLNMYGKKMLFDVEKFIEHEDKKRKSKMTVDKLAKEVLLFDNCYIIKKENLKKFITKGWRGEYKTM